MVEQNRYVGFCVVGPSVGGEYWGRGVFSDHIANPQATTSPTLHTPPCLRWGSVEATEREEYERALREKEKWRLAQVGSVV